MIEHAYPIYTINSFCTGVSLEIIEPTYKAKPATIALELSLACEELPEQNHWRVSLGVNVDSKHTEGISSNFLLDISFESIVYLQLQENHGLSNETLTEFLAQTTGGSLLAQARVQIHNLLNTTGYMGIVMPPFKSEQLVAILHKTMSKESQGAGESGITD